MLQRDLVLFGGRIEQVDHLAGDFAKVDAAKAGGPVPHLDLGDPQQRGKGPQDHIQLKHNVADQRLVLRLIEPPVVGVLQAAAHPRQRCPQIVRHIVGNLPVQLDQFFEIAGA